MMLFATTLFGQYSRIDAIDLVLNSILADDVGNVDVYCSSDTKTMPVDLIDNDTRPNPFSESWVFFSNDNPFASWYHSSRVIFVSAVDGAYTVADVEIYPKDLSSDYEEISMASRPAPIAMDGTAFVPNPEKVLSDYNYALIIVSMDEYRNWYNTSLIYNVLLQNYNYQKDNITVLYSWDGHSYLPDVNGDDLDGDFVEDDIDGPATYANIQTTITNLTNDLGHGDQLAVFFTGVPVQAVGPTVKMGFSIDANKIGLYDVSSISQAFDLIDCGQMVFNFDVNSSTEVMSYFEAVGNANALCQNRYLTGPTGQYENNYSEMYFSSGNYSEQLFYWASAARGYLPLPEEPWLYNSIAIGYENEGGFPYANVITGHPGDDYLDEDNDNFIQMGEAFAYADKMNTWSDDGYCYLPFISGGGGNDPLITPAQTDEFSFEEDLITLAGLLGHIENNQTIPARSYIFANSYPPIVYSLTIDEGVELSFDNGSELYFSRANLISSENSILNFGTGTTIEGFDPLYSEMDILGTGFTIGENSTISNIYISMPGFSINNLMLNNIDFYNIDNFIYYGNNLEITECYFESTDIIGWLKSVELQHSIFDNSSAYLECVYSNGTANIGTCVFDGIDYFLGTSLNVQYFENFSVQNNRISNNSVGMFVIGSGWGVGSAISNNEINNCVHGLSLYWTKARLTKNNIHNNENHGLILQQTCNVSLLGNKQATTVEETQRIMDNGMYEMVAWDYESFPAIFEWNAIIDDDNLQTNDQLVYCPINQPIIEPLDVRNNCWGNNFTPSEDLYPSGYYIWDPVFELEYNDGQSETEKLLFNSGKEKFEQGLYVEAKNVFLQVVEQYPNSRYANTSLKELLSLEKFVSNDYAGLKQYFLTNTNIANDSSLNKLGNFLAINLTPI